MESLIGPLVVVPILISVMTFVIGLVVFMRLTPRFAEERESAMDARSPRVSSHRQLHTQTPHLGVRMSWSLTVLGTCGSHPSRAPPPGF